MHALKPAMQVVGAILILLAYALTMFKVITQESYSYQFLNVVGSAILGVLAWQTQQWGFLLLETVWTGISLFAIGRRLAQL
jgi:hypothetical protein